MWTWIVLVSGLVVSGEVDVGYDRERMYGGWRGGDCMNTRHEVLVEESLVEVELSEDGCKVVSGLWYDPYTSKTFTDSRKLDVDHLVPLKEAHQSGAAEWNDEERRDYANDLSNPGHLIAVEARVNRRKGAKDVAEWLPPNESFRCAYVMAWVGVKKKWGLTVDYAEERVINEVLGSC